MSKFDQRGQIVLNQMNAEVINRNSYVVYIGKLIQERELSTHKIIQMREVYLDLKLPDNSYPTQRWIEKISASGILTDQNIEITNENWNPDNYSYGKIKDILMQEINKWSSIGWELLENEIDNLWEFEIKKRKTAGTEFLGEFIGLFGGLAWKYKKIFFGARFHIKRAIDSSKIR